MTFFLTAHAGRWTVYMNYPDETEEVSSESSDAGRSMFGGGWFETDTPKGWNKNFGKK